MKCARKPIVPNMGIATLPAGTIVTVGGIPLRLCDDTKIESHPANIDLLFKTEPWKSSP